MKSYHPLVKNTRLLDTGKSVQDAASEIRRSQARRAVKKKRNTIPGQAFVNTRGLNKLFKNNHLEQKIRDFLFKARNKLEEKACFWSTSKKVHQRERAEITAEEKVQQILEIAYTGRKVSVQKGIRAA